MGSWTSHNLLASTICYRDNLTLLFTGGMWSEIGMASDIAEYNTTSCCCGGVPTHVILYAESGQNTAVMIAEV
jgi:hypothetical protein